MIGKTIAAYTGPTPDIGFVAYINIAEANVGVKISIRSASEDGQEYAHIVMPKGEAEKLFAEALSRPSPVDGELVEAQIDRLATFIMENIDGEPSQSEGAVDCAIRLLSHPTDARKVIEDCVEAFINLEANPFERGVWIDVNNALTAAQDYLGEK